MFQTNKYQSQHLPSSYFKNVFRLFCCLFVCTSLSTNAFATCEDFNALLSILCPLDSDDDTYEIIITYTGNSTDGYTIVDNSTGESLTVNSGSIFFGPFEQTTGYSYTVFPMGHPECAITEGSAAVACGTVALELLSFEGKASDQGNQLYWQTATEANSDYFTVERSKDGRNFEAIEQIKAKGNSQTIEKYEFLDESVLARNSFYRLLETDVDGLSKVVSNVIEIQREQRDFKMLSVYPIPANNFITIEFSTPKNETVGMMVYNIEGELIERKTIETTAGIHQLKLDLSEYRKGTYFMNLISSDNEPLMHRFAKQ